MRKEGHISLYHKTGECIASGRYHNPSERRFALGKWKKRYGKGFDSCYIQIRPDTSDILVKKNGENINRAKTI